MIRDVDPVSWCLSTEELEGATARRRVVIPVNVYAAMAPLDPWIEAGYDVIEDCCHSVEASLSSDENARQRVVAVGSFYATKSVTAGQGGLVWSHDIEVVEAVRDYRQFDERSDYLPRFNFHMTDLQSALSTSQMRRLEKICDRRAVIAHRYDEVVQRRRELRRQQFTTGALVYRCVVRVGTPVERDALKRFLADRGVATIVPVTPDELLHRLMRDSGCQAPVAEMLAATTLSLPIHMDMSDEMVDQVCDALGGFWQ